MKTIYSLIFLCIFFSCKKGIEYHKNLDLVWESEHVNWNASSLTIDENFIYGHTMNDSIFKMNFSNGKVLWKKYSYGSYTTLKPLVYHDYIYIGGANKLKAFNKKGEILWSESTGTKTMGLVIADSIIFNTRTDDGLFANDAKSGNELWSIKPDYQMLSTSAPSIMDSLLIIGNFDYIENIGNHLACINLNKKMIQWKIENGGYINSEALIENNTVLFNSDSIYQEGFTFKTDLNNGKVLWKTKTYPEVLLPPLSSKGKIYINSYKKGIICLDSESGEIIWTLNNKDLTAGTEFLLHKEVLYFGTQNRTLIGVNKKGEIVFKSDFEYGIGNPFVYNDSVYVTDGNNRLFKIRDSIADKIDLGTSP